MAEIDRQTFEIVRRGYNIDRVDEFLIRQADAWRNELDEERRRISKMESELARIAPLEAEVEQARRQQEALTMMLQTAATARDEMLAKAEQDAAVVLTKAEVEAAEELKKAKAQAATVLTDAEQEADDIRHQSRMRTDELMMAQEEQLQTRQDELDVTHAEATQSYELAEQALATKIKELNAMREALVTGLEAIAGGGLAALEDVGDVLADVGIVGNDDAAVRQLLDSNGEPISSAPPTPADSALIPTDSAATNASATTNGSSNGSTALNGSH